MTRDEVQHAVVEALRRIAPEIDTSALLGGVPIREQADLDSMDFLNFLIALQGTLGVDIPEAAYGEVATIDGCVAYVLAHNPTPAPAKPADR